MVIRKPYAFLIKNFKKIHIVLLVLSIYVVYKLFDVSSYVNEFMRLGTYDMFGDPITRHINVWLTLSILLLILGSATILALLSYKGKPWKIYLIPIIEYLVLLFVLSMTKNFFSGYSTTIDTADLRLARDLLLIVMIAQTISIGIFGMRVLGLDMKKFQFNFDEEFLELSEADREEFEIGLNYDKYSFIRGYRRVIRYLKYFYLEHRSVCRTVIILLVALVGFRTWKYFFVTHKSYSEGEHYSVNGYTFIVNKVYYTDKDLSGNEISKDSSFVIVDISAINYAESRVMNLENFHIRNATEDYTTTRKIYANKFQDLGIAYESTKEIKKDQQLDFIIIYKVDKKLKKNRFVLYYQEKSGILRKIKLKVQDLSSVAKIKELSLGDEVVLNLSHQEENIEFNYATIQDRITYSARNCINSICATEEKQLVATDSIKFLEIEFTSDTYEAKNMIDFLMNYGKLSYIDNKDEKHVLSIDNPIQESYYGKTVFLAVPVELEQAKSVYFDLIVRNQQYRYQII